MFSSKKLLVGLLALALAWSPASAQLATTHAGTVGGPSGKPISNACINSSGTTITFTAQGVGNAAASRITVVTIAWDDSTAAGTAELTAMTVAGITMTRAVRAVGDNQNSNSEIWYAANPTGTTANIVATFSTAVDGITIEVYRLVGYDTVSATTTGTTSVTQAYDNKQLALAVGSRRVNVSTSLSNMTNDFSSACGASLWGVHASAALHGNGGSLTSAISPTSSTPLIALAKWRVGFAASCAESTAFIARTSGLSNTAKTNYDNLICGMVTDGTFALFDFLYIYAAPDSTTALLNLKSSSFNGTVNGSLTFTANQGFTGTAGSTTVYIDTGFNPTTQAGTSQFQQNSAHISVWNLTNATTTHGPIGGANGSINNTLIFPRYTDNNAYFRVNVNGIGDACSTAAITGHFIANHNTVNNDCIFNGVNNSSYIDTSVGVLNLNLYTIGLNNGGIADGSGQLTAMASGGAGFSAPQYLATYNRLRTYMTAVGVP